MGTGDVEQSHRWASHENGILPGSVGWIYGRKLCSLRIFKMATPPLHGQGQLPLHSQESASGPGE